jgi:hypothetical protein
MTAAFRFVDPFLRLGGVSGIQLFRLKYQYNAPVAAVKAATPNGTHINPLRFLLVSGILGKFETHVVTVIGIQEKGSSNQSRTTKTSPNLSP